MSPVVRAALFPLLLAAAVTAAEKTPGLPKHSPFMPAANAATPVETNSERIEFAGVSSVGSQTDLIFYDKTAKKNHWVSLGETKNGISVVSYDAVRELATVKIDGTQKVLPLRKVARTANAPRPVTTLPAASGFATPTPFPDAGAIVKIQPQPPPSDGTNNAMPPGATAPATQPATPPATPEAQAQVKAETEARMLVSDLLEIGMAQRKAYEEAQRKAAEGNTQNTSAATTPQNSSAAATPPAR